MSAFVSASAYLTDDRAASAYVQVRFRDLQALKADLCPNNVSVGSFGSDSDVVLDLGYVTVTKTAAGWFVDNLPAIGIVAVQAYILAKFW